MHPLATRRVRIVLAALLASCTAAPAAAFDWQVELTPAGELFPVLALSQPARRGGLLMVRVSGPDAPPGLTVRVETAGLARPALAAAGPAAGGRVLRPDLDWDLAALRRLRGTRRQPLRVTLEGGGVRETRLLDVRLHPLDDAPYYVREGRDRVDLGWVFAAYVDPRAAAVDAVLASARSLDPAFDAPAADPRARDLRRAAAVWAALERRGLAYAGDDPALSRGPAVWSQRVRLPDDTWRDRRASCIDGSVLLASVFERLGMRPFIVLVPGHAFAGFRHADGTREFLETTLLGAAAPAGDADARAARHFAAALRAGRARGRAAAARLDGRHAPAWALIDIGTARAYGIIALAVGDRDSTPSAAARRADGN
jgi:hypothetical protein